jgi:hypothetical protein
MTTCVVAVSKPDAASLVRDVASPAAHFNWNRRGFGCNQQYPERTRAATRAIRNTRPTNFLIMMRPGPSFPGSGDSFHGAFLLDQPYFGSDDS